MNKIKFIQIQKDNLQHYEALKDLMLPYMKELNVSNQNNEPESEDIILKFAKSCVSKQGLHDRHLELVYIGEEIIGFLYGKIDHEEHIGHKKIGYGYIMEFYVKPDYRRMGYGKYMFRRLEYLFSNNGAEHMYLNTGILGEPFWRAMGFKVTNEVQTDNNMIIYEKEIAKQNKF